MVVVPSKTLSPLDDLIFGKFNIFLLFGLMALRFRDPDWLASWISDPPIGHLPLLIPGRPRRRSRCSPLAPLHSFRYPARLSFSTVGL
jgi:hypothetical protein